MDGIAEFFSLSVFANFTSKCSVFLIFILCSLSLTAGLTTVSLLIRRDQELLLSEEEEGDGDYETVEEEGVKDDVKEDEREDDDEAVEEEGVTDDDEDEEG